MSSPLCRVFSIVAALTTLVPSQLLSQVNIKEKVEIKPNQLGSISVRGQSGAKATSGLNRFFNPPLFVPRWFDQLPQLTLPSSLTIAGTVNIQGEIEYNQQAFVIVTGVEYQVAWKRRASKPYGGAISEGASPYTAIFGKGSYPPVELWVYDNSGWGSGGTQVSIGAGGLYYSFAGNLNYPYLLVTGTATATGSFLPNVVFDHWALDPQQFNVTGLDSMGLYFDARDADDHSYQPWGIPFEEGPYTVRVDAHGDYAYLAYDEYQFDASGNNLLAQVYHSGKELSMTLSYRPRLIYDERKGTFSGNTDTVQVTISGGGKTKTVPITLTKNEIMLGETKYYQAIPDPFDQQRLIFREMSQTSDWVAGGQPARFVVTSTYPQNRLGVYYEYRDNDNLPLAGDMIRLVGRYWTKDTTYKVLLRASSGTRSGNMPIKVTRPGRLGTTYATATDVYGNEYNVDDLVVTFAGRSGIPPQFIKGQACQESNILPAYRYEPGVDFRIQSRPAKRAQYFRKGFPFVVVLDPVSPSQNSMGGFLPSDHNSVKPYDYQRTPVSISKFVGDRLGQYTQYDKKNHNRIRFLGPPVGTEITRQWESYYNWYRILFLGLDDAAASKRALAKITSNLKEGKVSTDFNRAAQTRIVASYGIVQITHYSATDKNLNGYMKTAAGKLPEYLNDNAELMPAYIDFSLRNLKRDDVLGVNTPSSEWSLGFERTWNRVAGWYNPVTDPNDRPIPNNAYGNLVMQKANMFLPKR